MAGHKPGPVGVFDVPGALEDICSMLENGETQSAIARKYGVKRNAINRWISGDEEKTKAVLAARRAGAEARLDLAQEGLEKAADQFELARAKEMAHHHRYVAAKLNPVEFGDKVQIGGAADLPPVQTQSTVDMSGLSVEQLRAISSIRLNEG